MNPFIKLHRSRFFLFTFLFFCSNLIDGKDQIQISLLSCSPGEDLYSIFGHSAIRIKDADTGRDVVFNYGTFDFSEKNFYLKFLRGKLNYILSTSSFDDFLYSYTLENRTVYEQIFDLDSMQKAQLLYRLQENALPAHRAYKYDFFWDNCSTRIRDKIQESYPKKLQYPPIPDATFRDYLHDYLKDSPWSRFGIDLILGLPADNHMKTEEAMFLPLEMMKIYDETLIENKPTNSHSKVILPADIRQDPVGVIFTPFIIFSVLLLLIILGFLFKRTFWAFQFLNHSLLLICGLAGCLITFLWFFADHITTDYNMHLLWANPILVLYMWRKNLLPAETIKWVTRAYLFILLGLILFLPLLPQAMPFACIPIWISLIIIIVPDIGLKKVDLLLKKV